jgi:hypothetical protein
MRVLFTMEKLARPRSRSSSRGSTAELFHASDRSIRVLGSDVSGSTAGLMESGYSHVSHLRGMQSMGIDLTRRPVVIAVRGTVLSDIHACGNTHESLREDDLYGNRSP